MNINIISTPTKWSIIIDGELHKIVEGDKPSELFNLAGKVIGEYLYWHSVSSDCVTLTMSGILQCQEHYNVHT